MMMLNLAPPRSVPNADLLHLGATVRYTHRAAVARWKITRDPRGYGREWILVEGVPRGGWRPEMSAAAHADVEGNTIETSTAFGFEVDPFYERDPGPGGPNKTVIVWPEEGAGVVTGLVRRGIGQSSSPSGGTGMFDDDWEPGGFLAEAFVPLYAVRHRLAGTEYVLCPVWAVTLDT